MNIKSGTLNINNASLYYEEVGQGQPIIFVHAGVADLRMWDDQFSYFEPRYRVIRFDMRGYGRSPAVPGAYSSRDDLMEVLNILGVESAILVGCSRGGMTILDFAIEHPDRVAALIPVASGLSGFEYEGDHPPFWEEMEQAVRDGNYDLAAEFDVRIWFDSRHRTPDQVDPVARAKALEMARTVYQHPQDLGKYIPLTPPAIERLDALRAPMLVIAGSLDDPNIRHIADLLVSTVPGSRKVIFENTAHLPNLELPADFNQAIDEFLKTSGFL